MSTEKMREEFQKWWRHHDQNEVRASCTMGWAFAIWQASRAAIEVELPEVHQFYGASSECEEGFEVWAVQEVIESLGLKVKP